MGSAPYRILLIEDDPDSAEAFRVLFDFWGYRVDVVGGAAEALAHAASKLPEAIVLDLGLPTFADGCALLKQIRGMPGGDDVLIVAVTGHGRDTYRRQAIGAGCDFFFVKPADVDDLHSALSRIKAHRGWVARARLK